MESKNFKQYFEQYYEALKNMYVDEITYHKDFKQVKSNIIDDGIWNFVYDIKAKNYQNFINIFEKTKRLFIDRVPRFYVLKSDENSQYLDKIKKDYDLYCEDSWFCTPLDKLSLNYKAKIDVKVEISNNKEEIIDCIMDGFSTHDPDDPYGDLSPTYRESLNKKLSSKKCEYQTIHYVARYKRKMVSIASITIVGKNAFLNNVTTLKDYKGKAISKEILTFAINDLKTKNIEDIIFATETNAYTETYYKKLGFEVVDYGYCFQEN